jgi:carboxypeptidase Taq
MSDLIKFRALMKEVSLLSSISSTLAWDMRVNLPIKATTHRAEVMSFLSGKLYAIKTSSELKELCDKLSGAAENDPVMSAMIKKALKEHKKLSSIPAKLMADYIAHNSKTELLWQEARKKND